MCADYFQKSGASGITQSTRLGAGHRAPRAEHSTTALRMVEKRISANLEQLHRNLWKVESRCNAIGAPGSTAEALVEFKRLTPVVEEVISFIAVIETHTAQLEEERRIEVEAQLALLRRRLLRLHLDTAGPLLRQVADARDPLPLGTNHVMARWLKYLRENEDLLRTLSLGADQIDEDCAQIESVREYALLIAERSPELQDFDAMPVRRERAPAELPPPGGVRRLAAPASKAPPVNAEIDSPVLLALSYQEGRAYVDTRGSSGLAVEIRRLGVSAGLASAMGVPPSTLVMILNGRDPIPSDRVHHVADFLKKTFGPRFTLVDH